MSEKIALRKQIHLTFQKNESHNYAEEDQRSCNALRSSALYRSAEILFAFAPLESEINLYPLLAEAADEKQLALPVTHSDGSLTFHLVEDLTSLRASAYGIYEPQGGVLVTPKATDLIIVPALAYTKEGVRLGRGKGFYDRYLAVHREAPTIGVCRSFQLLATIPHQSWDRKVDHVLVAGAWY